MELSSGKNRLKEICLTGSRNTALLLKSNNNSIQFCIYLRAELNSRWPITESARSIKQTAQLTKDITHKKIK
jgi:hypothetical protein